MISISEVIIIHDILIDKFGGHPGLRDKGLLDSAIFRPFQMFDNKELYPGAIKKSAVLIESIIKNHPFIDGNKRIGYVIMRLFLLENGYDIVATQEEKYDFVIRIAAGESNMDDIIKWIQKHISIRDK